MLHSEFSHVCNSKTSLMNHFKWIGRPPFYWSGNWESYENLSHLFMTTQLEMAKLKFKLSAFSQHCFFPIIPIFPHFPPFTCYCLYVFFSPASITAWILKSTEPDVTSLLDIPLGSFCCASFHGNHQASSFREGTKLSILDGAVCSQIVPSGHQLSLRDEVILWEVVLGHFYPVSQQTFYRYPTWFNRSINITDGGDNSSIHLTNINWASTLQRTSC